MTIYVLYHAQCPDGFGAAYAAWKRFGEDAAYVPVQHGNPMPTVPEGTGVYIVDFSYAKDALQALARRTQFVAVLDHHKSAQAALQGLPSLPPLGREGAGLCVHFDMNHSGAALAWNHFHPGQAMPELLAYVQDNDLWRFALPESREVNAALHSYPFDFALWDRLEVEALKVEGKPILRALHRMVESLCRDVQWRDIGGYRVPVVNTTLLASQVGNRLCQLYPQAAFAACYADHVEQRHWELRSIGEFDVSRVAVQYGGGGHRNAAGFSESLDIS